jgi:predicted O-linked N-acetylglucosamine transferase (SPINDLY family)
LPRQPTLKTDPPSKSPHTGFHPLLPKAAALHQAGRLDEAAALYDAILLEIPGHFDATHLLGVVALQQGRLDDAERKIGAALEIEPDNIAALSNLTAALLRAGKFDLAAEKGAKALRTSQPPIDALVNYGTALHQLGRHREAIAPLEAAFLQNQRSPLVCSLLGACFMQVGDFPRAATVFEFATIAAPMDRDAWSNRAAALTARSQHDAALACTQRAAELGRDSSNALTAQAASLLELGKVEESIVAYEAAAAANPTMEVLCQLARALIISGRNDDALPHLRRAIEADGSNPFVRLMLAVSVLKTISRDTADIEASRAAFTAAIEELRIWYARNPVKEAYVAVGATQPFFAAYHPYNNRDLLRPYGELCVSWMKSLPIEGIDPPPAISQEAGRGAHPRNRRIRVGIVSAHVRYQSVWIAILKGWVHQLDKSKFDLWLFKLDSLKDDETEAARAHVTRLDDQPKSLSGWVQAILAAELDVLIYDEIGMDALTLQLAAMRLVPLQAATWGHPETTGLPTIDCYISASDFEPPAAQNNYAERLIQLPHFGTYVEPLNPTVRDPDLHALGLPPDEPLLLCAGSPFKYSPLDDGVWVDIARGLEANGRGRLVFFIPTSGSMHLLLTERLRASFATQGVDFDSRVCLIPVLDRARYFGLMQRSTLMLDTLGFSGFNTALQAVESGLPYLAFEGEFMRGRLASALMRRMNLPELVATTRGEFVRRAVDLAADGARLDDLRSTMAERRPVLFSDLAPIRALEQFLTEETQD